MPPWLWHGVYPWRAHTLLSTSEVEVGGQECPPHTIFAERMAGKIGALRLSGRLLAAFVLLH